MLIFSLQFQTLQWCSKATIPKGPNCHIWSKCHQRRLGSAAVVYLFMVSDRKPWQCIVTYNEHAFEFLSNGSVPQSEDVNHTWCVARFGTIFTI